MPGHTLYAAQWSPPLDRRDDCVSSKDYWYNGQGKPFSKDSGLYITMKPNQTIVFNFKEATTVELSKAVVNLGDGTGDHTTNTVNGAFGDEQNIYADKINQRLVWNCPKATNIDTHISGGIYLAPQNNAKMTLGDTTTGWGVCAGEVIMGKTSEYHFVYQGLKKENGVTLKATCLTVMAIPPAKRPIFSLKMTVRRLKYR